MRWALLTISVLGCQKKDLADKEPVTDADTDVDSDSDADSDTDADTDAAPDWSVAASNLVGGTLLSAWTHGEEIWMVGGDLSDIVGTTGSIARVDPVAGTVCVEEGIADHTLWWIYGATEDDWYAVGAMGTIIHEKAGVRTDESVPTDATLFGVWATADAVYAVGTHVLDSQTGELWIRRNETWTLAATSPSPMFKVWAGPGGQPR